MPVPGTAYSQCCCHSVDEQEKAMPGWNQTYSQMESGAFQGEVIRFALPEVELYRETLGQQTENHFCDPEGAVTVYFQRDAAQGRIVRAGFSHAHRPRPFVYRRQDTILLAVFPESAFGPSRALERDSGIWSGVPAGSLASVGDWIDRLLNPRNGALYREDADFIGLAPKLLHDQVSLWFDQPGWSGGVLPRARVVVNDLLEWLREAPIDMVSAADAARGTGHSTRDLREVCRAEIEMTLERLLTVRRLNLVRRALRRADPGTRVSDLALDHGFAHWGRFSALYREFFGELPSETLRGLRAA